MPLYYVKTLTGKTVTLDCEPWLDIEGLCQKIEDKEGIPPRECIRMLKGPGCQHLEFGRSLSDYNIEPESTFHMVLMLRQGSGRAGDSTYDLYQSLKWGPDGRLHEVVHPGLEADLARFETQLADPLPSKVHQRLQKEIDVLGARGDGFAGGPVNKDICCNVWQCIVPGGHGTPYEGGTFKVQFTIPPDYPFKPPVLKFLTYIYHPGFLVDLDMGTNIPQPAGAWEWRDEWDPTKKHVRSTGGGCGFDFKSTGLQR